MDILLKGSPLDLDQLDVETILNASPLASVPGFQNIFPALSTAIASVNTQIWTTQNTGDLFWRWQIYNACCPR